MLQNAAALSQVDQYCALDHESNRSSIRGTPSAAPIKYSFSPRKSTAYRFSVVFFFFANTWYALGLSPPAYNELWELGVQSANAVMEENESRMKAIELQQAAQDARLADTEQSVLKVKEEVQETRQEVTALGAQYKDHSSKMESKQDEMLTVLKGKGSGKGFGGKGYGFSNQTAGGYYPQRYNSQGSYPRDTSFLQHVYHDRRYCGET